MDEKVKTYTHITQNREKMRQIMNNATKECEIHINTIGKY